MVKARQQTKTGEGSRGVKRPPMSNSPVSVAKTTKQPKSAKKLQKKAALGKKPKNNAVSRRNKRGGTKHTPPLKPKKRLSETQLSPEQEMFCELFASDREFFGNGVQSYVEAYDVDTSKPNWYKTARACASRLLTKANILRRIDEVFEARGLSDQFVDKQLEKLITQDADFTNKMAAIKEYNKLKQRITDKLDLTSAGEKLAAVALVEFVDGKSKRKNTK